MIQQKYNLTKKFHIKKEIINNSVLTQLSNDKIDTILEYSEKFQLNHLMDYFEEATGRKAYNGAIKYTTISLIYYLANANKKLAFRVKGHMLFQKRNNLIQRIPTEAEIKANRNKYTDETMMALNGGVILPLGKSFYNKKKKTNNKALLAIKEKLEFYGIGYSDIKYAVAFFEFYGLLTIEKGSYQPTENGLNDNITTAYQDGESGLKVYKAFNNIEDALQCIFALRNYNVDFNKKNQFERELEGNKIQAKQFSAIVKNKNLNRLYQPVNNPRANKSPAIAKAPKRYVEEMDRINSYTERHFPKIARELRFQRIFQNNSGTTSNRDWLRNLEDDCIQYGRVYNIISQISSTLRNNVMNHFGYREIDLQGSTLSAHYLIDNGKTPNYDIYVQFLKDLTNNKICTNRKKDGSIKQKNTSAFYSLFPQQANEDVNMKYHRKYTAKKILPASLAVHNRKEFQKFLENKKNWNSGIFKSEGIHSSNWIYLNPVLGYLDIYNHRATSLYDKLLIPEIEKNMNLLNIMKHCYIRLPMDFQDRVSFEKYQKKVIREFFKFRRNCFKQERNAKERGFDPKQLKILLTNTSQVVFNMKRTLKPIERYLFKKRDGFYQQVESNTLLIIINKMIKKGMIPFTVHDAIYVKASEFKEFENLFNSEIQNQIFKFIEKNHLISEKNTNLQIKPHFDKYINYNKNKSYIRQRINPYLLNRKLKTVLKNNPELIENPSLLIEKVKKIVGLKVDINETLVNLLVRMNRVNRVKKEVRVNNHRTIYIPSVIIKSKASFACIINYIYRSISLYARPPDSG